VEGRVVEAMLGMRMPPTCLPDYRHEPAAAHRPHVHRRSYLDHALLHVVDAAAGHRLFHGCGDPAFGIRGLHRCAADDGVSQRLAARCPACT
jgi:hypothetical protein